MDLRLVLFLLDSSQGHPLQAWSFDGQDMIRIGRSPDNDIVVPHPCVSRAHAYMIHQNDVWRVTALSQQGLIHSAETVLDLMLRDGDIFRLGPGGPYLRYTTEESACLTTASRRLEPPVSLALDQERLTREVSAITDNSYFQQLQASIKKLRGQ